MYSVDLLTRWADRLTYRLMKLAGTKQETLDKYVQAVIDRNEKLVESDQVLKGKLNIAALLKWSGVLIGIYLVFRIVKMFR